MKGIFTVLAIGLVLGGCVSTRTTTLSGGEGGSLQGKTVVLVRRAKPDFAAMTPGKAMFGLIGAEAMIIAGNKLVTDDAIEDPAGAIGEQLRLALSERHGLVALPGDPPLVDTTDTARLAALSPDADFVLDAQTVNWSFVYRPHLGTQHYRVIYSVKARLVDARKKTLRAEAFCVRNDDGDANPPTYEELLADHAAILKTRLAEHGRDCIGELKQKLLGTVGA